MQQTKLYNVLCNQMMTLSSICIRSVAD